MNTTESILLVLGVVVFCVLVLVARAKLEARKKRTVLSPRHAPDVHWRRHRKVARDTVRRAMDRQWEREK